MGRLGAPHVWKEWKKKVLLLKLCYRYPTMMKLDAVISYLKKIQIYINHVPHLRGYADFKIFSVIV